MNKKWFIIILGLVLVFVGVLFYIKQDRSITSAPDTINVEDNLKFVMLEDQSLKKYSYFKLGLTRDEVYLKIKELGYKIKLDQKLEYGGIWCENIHFGFDKDNKVSSIFITNIPEYKTVKGLAMGDDIKKTAKLYGDKYYIYAEPYCMIYEYEFKSNYFQVEIDNERNVITGFGISSKKYN